MANNDFYFKVKPERSAHVKAISSIKLPLFEEDDGGIFRTYVANIGVPGTGYTAKTIAKEDDDGSVIEISDGSPWLQDTFVSFEEAQEVGMEAAIAEFIDKNSTNSPWNPTSDMSGFVTPEEAWAYRYGSDTETTLHYSRNNTSFQTIFCEWDRNKFTNFVIESLVGKALLQAIAYNYFGYPVSNVNRFIDLNPEGSAASSSPWLGRMPNFGTNADPLAPIPPENMDLGPAQDGMPGFTGVSVVGDFTIIGDSRGKVSEDIAGSDPYNSGIKFLQLYDVEFLRANTEDLFSRYVNMLGANRPMHKQWGFMGAVYNFHKYYTNSYVFEIRGFPGTKNPFGDKTPNLAKPTPVNPAGEGVSGTPFEENFEENKYKGYTSGECPDSNYYEMLNAQYSIMEGTDLEEPEVSSQKGYHNRAYNSPWQPLTPTRAKLWFPSMKTALTRNPLHTIMGCPSGFRTTDWYYNQLDLEALSGGSISAEELKEDSYTASFKTNNLVSMFKLVPAGTQPKDLQLYLDNPHLTINHITPKILSYLTQVVPKNPRYAGPKPVTEEPDARTERYEPLPFEKPWHPIEPPEGVHTEEQAEEYNKKVGDMSNWFDTQRVLSGSFFEFQAGRKWTNAPILARDPRRQIPNPDGKGGLIENTNYEKLSTPEVGKFIDVTAGKVGTNEKWIASVPKKNIEYATKFGLWNNDWIGGGPVKHWKDDGSYQSRTSEATGVTGGGTNAVSCGGFMLLPKNPRTIYSMIDSLPSYGTGKADIAMFLDSNASPLAITKMLSDLWVSYHFATKPNGMGWQGDFWKEHLGLFTFMPSPQWSKETFLTFRTNFQTQDKIKGLKDSGAGDKDTVKKLYGGVSEFTDNHYDDVKPLLYSNGPRLLGGEMIYGKAYNDYQLKYAGFPSFKISTYLEETLGVEGMAKHLLKHPWDQDESKFMLLTGKNPNNMNTVSTSGMAQIVENALTFDLSELNMFKNTNVPIFVNRYSLLEFPIWRWKRGGDQGFADLDDISWGKLIEDGNQTQYTQEVYDLWTPYIEENPLLVNQPRECIPKWVHSLSIYPTVKQDAIQYGLVPGNLPMSAQTVKFSAWDNSTEPYLEAAAQGNWSAFETEDGKPLGIDTGYSKTVYDNQIVFSKKSYVIGEEGEGFNQFGDTNPVAQYQKSWIEGKGGEFADYIDSQLRTYKTTDSISKACKPWMVLEYKTNCDITDANYRQMLDIPYVDLTYAVELEIDDAALVVDLVKMGIVGLAGSSAEYTALGINLDDLFLAAFSNGGSSLYSKSLSDAYLSFEQKILGGEFAGLEFDFGAFPNLDVTKNLSKEKALEIVAGLSRIFAPSGLNPDYLKRLEDNYAHIRNVPKVDAPISSFIWDKAMPEEVAIYSAPGTGSPIIGYVKNFSTVKVLKEWVNGGKKRSASIGTTTSGEWNKVQVIDPDAGEMDEVIGYIRPQILNAVIKDLFMHSGEPEFSSEAYFKQIYDKNTPGASMISGYSSAEIKPMSEMAKALIPTWWKMTEPYYHLGDGEYWITVELKGENCVVDDSDLEEKKKIAQKEGIKSLFDFYTKSYTDKDVDNLADAYLASRVDDYHLDLRPGSSIKFLVKVGAIYFNSFSDTELSLQQLRGKAENQLTLNEKYYTDHVTQALFSLNKMYLEIFASKYALKGVDLLQEMKRLEQVPVLVKKFLAINGVQLGTPDENTIEIGLNTEFKIVYIAYKKHDETEFKVLKIGVDHFRNLSPLNNTNTMSLFYHHRLLRNPMLKWQDMVKLYLVNPKPEIIEKDLNNMGGLPSAPCKPFTFVLPRWEDVLGPIAAQLDKALQLDPRFDLGSFQFSLLKYFPPCPKPPSGIGDAVLLGEFDVNGEKYTFEDVEALTAFGAIADGEKIQEYVGDWLASSGALEDIQSKIIDLDDLFEYVLDYIDPPTLYAKICKCFLDQIGIDTISVPNLELDANAGSVGANVKPNLGSSALSGENQAEIGYEVKGPTASVNTDPKDLEASDLICSFCMEIPSFFLRLPTTNLLDELLNALLAVLEFILAQLLLELIKALLDLLLQCPEITCPVGEKKVKDYGGQNLGDIFTAPDLPPVDEYFSECGILIDGNSVTGDDVIEMMTNISSRLSSGEVLGLLGGGITDTILTVADEEISKYPEIKIQLNNRSRIEDFFTCAGLGLPKQTLADIEDDITDTYENPELCTNLLADAKAQLSERCGVNDLLDSSAKRALEFDIDKYKALADAIRNNQDLSTQLPPMFGDCLGNQGVLSGLPNPTMDHAINKTVEQITIPIKNALNNDLKRLRQTVLVSRNPVTESMLNESLPGALLKLLTGPNKTFQDKLFPAGWMAGGYLYTPAGVTPYFPAVNLAFPSRGVQIPKKNPKTGEDELGIDEVLQDLEQNITIKKGSEDSPSSVVTVKVDEESEVMLEMVPPEEDEDGNLQYEYNMITKIKTQDMFGIPSDSKQTIDLTRLDKNTKLIPMVLKEHLEQYPLKKGSLLPPQAQYFSQLIISNIQSGDFQLSEENAEAFESIFANDIYWSVWSSVMDTLAESMANAELVQDYAIDKEDDILDSFDPLMLIPGLNLIFASLAAAEELAGGSFDDSFIAGLYRGTFLRKQMTRLKLESDAKADGYGSQLIDFEAVTKLVQDNYDFSKYHDPNSDQLGMPHYAILNGLINCLIQVFTGEMYIRSIVPLSKLPTDILLQDDSMAELIYREMVRFIDNSPGNFRTTIKEVIRELFKSCNSAGIPFSSDNVDDPEGGLPGVAKSQTAFGETNKRIENWEDGLKYLIEQNLSKPIPYLENKFSQFTLKGSGLGIGKINPVQAVSYPLMLQVYDEAFVDGIENVSIGSASRLQLFKNGKFFFQYYFDIVDWEPGDENYVEALVNRDAKFKGILSEDNFVELISMMSGIPSLYPPNTAQVQPLIAVDGNDPTKVEVENTGPSVAEMFKEINFGVRWCYGAVTTKAKDENDEPILKNQIKPVKDMFDNLLKILDLDGDNALKLISSAATQTGTHQTKEMNDYINFVNETKSLLMIENRTISVNKTASENAGQTEFTEPMFSLILPLFDERIKINNPSGDQEKAFDGGYKLLDNGLLEVNYKASEIRVFTQTNYGKKVVAKVIEGLTLNPAYEGVLSYSFPVPRMCSLTMLHSVLTASRSEEFKKAFNPTKSIIRTLIYSTTMLKGKDQYKNDFTDPFSG
tara:strand:- start:26404 stop:35910 length:9507 start_codon:yes stop_codon:yes gene_type:complete